MTYCPDCATENPSIMRTCEGCAKVVCSDCHNKHIVITNGQVTGGTCAGNALANTGKEIEPVLTLVKPVEETQVSASASDVTMPSDETMPA